MENSNGDTEPGCLEDDLIYQTLDLIKATPPEVIYEVDRILKEPEDAFLEREQIKQLTEKVARLEDERGMERSKREDVEVKLGKMVQFITFMHGEFGKLITSLVSLTDKCEGNANVLTVGPFQGQGDAVEFLEMLKDLSKQFQPNSKNPGNTTDLLQKVDLILGNKPGLDQRVSVSVTDQSVDTEQRPASTVSTVILDPDWMDITPPVSVLTIHKRRKQTGVISLNSDNGPDLSSMNKKHGKDHSKRHWGHYCLCGSKMGSATSLSSHIRYFSLEKKFKCSLCDDMFRGKSFLNTHMATKHKIIDLSSDKTCSMCKKEFDNWKDLRYHQRNQCGINSITQHGIDNTKSPNYVCLCGKKYSYRCTLLQHINSKMFGQLYKCQLCWQTFHLHWMLKRHYTTVHQVEQQENHTAKCLQCQETLQNMENLSEHLASVHGVINQSSTPRNHRRNFVDYSVQVENEIRHLLSLSADQQSSSHCNQTSTSVVNSTAENDNDVICID